MATLARAMLDAAIDLRKKQNGISEKDLENVIEAVMKGGASEDSFGSLENLGAFQQEENGRTYNNSTTMYFFPSDKPEWIRLDKQHAGVCLGLGGLNPISAVIQEVLRPEPGVTRRVLDLGCGTGVWALEMTRAFPHATVVGLDLVPVPVEKEKLPPNFKMEIGDINTDLPRFQGQFDLVYMRFIFAGVKDVRKTIGEVQQCLKPGGLLLSVTPDMRILDSDQNTVVPMATDENPDGSWLHRMQAELTHTAIINGTDELALGEFIDAGFWDDEQLMDPNTCGAGSLFLPMSPWIESSDLEEDTMLKLTGTLMRQNYMEMHRSWHVLCKRAGRKEELLDEWSALADKDFAEEKFKMWMRLRMAWGQRQAAPNQKRNTPNQYVCESLPIQLVDEKQVNHDPSDKDKPYKPSNTGVKSLSRIEVYRTKEESLKRARQIIDRNPPLTIDMTQSSVQ